MPEAGTAGGGESEAGGGTSYSVEQLLEGAIVYDFVLRTEPLNDFTVQNRNEED